MPVVISLCRGAFCRSGHSMQRLGRLFLIGAMRNKLECGRFLTICSMIDSSQSKSRHLSETSARSFTCSHEGHSPRTRDARVAAAGGISSFFPFSLIGGVGGRFSFSVLSSLSDVITDVIIGVITSVITDDLFWARNV